MNNIFTKAGYVFLKEVHVNTIVAYMKLHGKRGDLVTTLAKQL